MIALLAEWKWFLGAGLLLAAVLAINHYGDVRYTAGTAVCMKQDQAAANSAEAATDAANAAAITKNEGAENAESAELNVIAGLELQPVAAPVIRLCDSPPPRPLAVPCPQVQKHRPLDLPAPGHFEISLNSLEQIQTSSPKSAP